MAHLPAATDARPEEATREGLAIGQVARGAGVNIQTVRYYERRGRQEAPARRPSGQRTYEPSVVDLLRTVKRAQRLGFTLDEIEEILRMSQRAGRGPEALRRRMREKIAEIDGKIADLHAMRERLVDALHAGCDSLTSCTCPNCPFLIDIEIPGGPHARR